jgi:hypothetical protein
MFFFKKFLFLVVISFTTVQFVNAQEDYIGKVIASKGQQLKVLGKNMQKFKHQAMDTFMVYRDTVSANKGMVTKLPEMWEAIGEAVVSSATLNEVDFKLIKLNNGKTTEKGKAIKAERVIPLNKHVNIKLKPSTE